MSKKSSLECRVLVASLCLLGVVGCEGATPDTMEGELQNVGIGCPLPAEPPTLAPQTISLWPPNHKLHTIAVEDCVTATDTCQPHLVGEFIWASSDEPINGRGDGNSEPDIVFDDCGHVQVRAERAGPNDGRVYRLGVRVVDAAGNASESACTIVVDHSRNGVVAAESGTAYRVTLDGTNGTLACDGDVPAPEAPAAVVSQPDADPVDATTTVI